MSLHRLLPLFARARQSNEPLVLATVIRTGGSTYAKAGAQMLIASDGEYAGLLSGGCLEGDLREHAREVAAGSAARIVSYDLRTSTDQLFGLGAGCEGAMDVLLTRVSAADGWQPLDTMARHYSAGTDLRVAFVVASKTPDVPLGRRIPIDGALAPPRPLGTSRRVLVGFAAISGSSRMSGGPDQDAARRIPATAAWRRRSGRRRAG